MNSLPNYHRSHSNISSSTNHHLNIISSNNRFTHSLNRLTNTPQHQQSTLQPISIIRASRRSRILLIITAFISSVLIYYYWPQLKNRSLHSLSSSTNPDLFKIPTVSRDVLDVLEELDQSQLSDEEKAIREMLANNDTSSSSSSQQEEEEEENSTSLPVVSHLPSDLRHSSSSKPITCPDHLPSPCRFLIAGYIGEQETKAQIHLHQLGLLAMALNRTLVLPQLSQSRMGSCLEHPFDLYYHPSSLSQLGVRTITHDQFLIWANSHSESPTARLVAIVDHKQLPSTSTKGSVSYDHSTLTRDSFSFIENRQLCIRNNGPPSNLKKLSYNKNLNLNFNSFAPLKIVSPARWQKSTQTRDQLAEQIITSIRRSDLNQPIETTPTRSNKRDTLHSDPQSSEGEVPDTLVINYELRYPFLDPVSRTSQIVLRGGGGDDWTDHHAQYMQTDELKAFQHFPYASVWVDLAEALVKKAPAMIGIHWRQENMQVTELQKCATSLLLTLDSLKTSYPSLEAVYLSTDYPIEQVLNDNGAKKSAIEQVHIKAHSGTFSKSITQDHHAIMRELMKHPIPLKWYTFNTLIDTLDMSLGLLDKLMHLPVFTRIKEIDGMMKDTKKMEENRKELTRLIKDKLRLKAEPAGKAEEEEEEEGDGMDMGIIGIIEKLLLTRATLFLTGTPNQCSKLSSFTNQIVSERQRHADLTLAHSGYLLDYDFLGNSQPNLQRFNLVEFWGPSP
ncbi:hypothetical protein PCANC_09006 [Puccinia coronata f. sp. avenae]|uniref:Uncharacterized protein n=1 Tax=Puccinia coronata f. sp. avenae TaxID=200324 RepID=A0A2N5VHV0_9BASI|nr:hypothetical protein PCANC_09006 [Puccinia coronata f. sp. avenae]